MRVSRPSSSRTRSALAQVWRAWPYSWLSVVMEGVGIPGARVPSAISRRSRAARRTYALGSDSSLIDTLAPYSIGNIANRNASTLVDYVHGTQWCVTLGTWQVTAAGLLANPLGQLHDHVLLDGAERVDIRCGSRPGHYSRSPEGAARRRGDASVRLRVRGDDRGGRSRERRPLHMPLLPAHRRSLGGPPQSIRQCRLAHVLCPRSLRS